MFKSKIIICDDIWAGTLSEFLSNFLANTEEGITSSVSNVGPLVQEAGRDQQMARILEKISHGKVMSETGLFILGNRRESIKQLTAYNI